MGRKSNKQKEAERAFQEAKNAEPMPTFVPGNGGAEDMTPEALTAARNREALHSLAVERGSMAMRLAVVELVERRGLPELALEIATMKVKL